MTTAHGQRKQLTLKQERFVAASYFRGVESARSTVHPRRSILARIKDAGMPVDSSHSISDLVSPFIESMRHVRLFRDWSRLIVHRQLSGEYPRLLSIRSMLCLGVGRRPISSRNDLKLVTHDSQMVIPRPPYSLYLLFLGFVQRAFMPFHTWYSGNDERPCVESKAAADSRCTHPHEVVFPPRRLDWLTTVLSPHSQAQFQYRWDARRSDSEITVRRPKVCPVRSSLPFGGVLMGVIIP